MVKKIFLPFFTTKDKGVGMGLALAHKVIASHGGRIEVESEEGKGTVFTVILPAVL
jgi:signal transduction histidine kinase